nr:hypothetical protein [Nitrosomonas nitrosa]
MFELLGRLIGRRPLLERALVGDSSGELKEYIFVDRPRLRAYSEQIRGPRSEELVPAWDLNVSVAGPSLTSRRSYSVREFTDHERVEILIAHLRKHKLVTFSEPSARADAKTPFAFESIPARRVILDAHAFAALGELKEIAVWVAPPPGEALDHSGFTTSAFLYLVEAYWRSDDVCQTTYSGYSALNMILRELAETDALRNVPLPLLRGRKQAESLTPTKDDYLYDVSPLDALSKIGAQIDSERHIEVLYRKRYMSDEESFVDDNGRHRCRDLFAYPIFIREPTLR